MQNNQLLEKYEKELQELKDFSLQKEEPKKKEQENDPYKEFVPEHLKGKKSGKMTFDVEKLRGLKAKKVLEPNFMLEPEQEAPKNPTGTAMIGNLYNS